MASVFDSFRKEHEYLVCVDSDGCAMDTMDCKHFHCFGPCMVEEWGLHQWSDAILHRWNEINLFQMTRGINRFKGLALALKEIDQQYTPIIGLTALVNWVENAPALSNDGLEQALEDAFSEDERICLTKALFWSRAVNEKINTLPEELKVPYNGVLAGLAAASKFADVAVVSSANRDAVEEEWGKHGLLAYTDILLAQDCGSKASCIAKMLDFGYDKSCVLMVGDAPGDCTAAEKNGVWFFPILVNWEEESWADLRQNGFPALQNGTYADIQGEKKQVFVENLGG